jgi:predicted acylesterase/phospholipase RssA/CRP-like cAMP-binding protein
VIEKQIPIDELETISNFLYTIDNFNKLDRSTLTKLVSSMKLIFLEGGEILINEGECENSLFIVYHGRLRVYKTVFPLESDQESEIISKKYHEEMICEIAQGELVGEVSFLINSSRTRTVRAIRDSILLKLDQNYINQQDIQHINVLLSMSLSSLRRLVKTNKSTENKLNISNIAIAPAGNSNHIPFVEPFVKALNKIKPTILVNRSYCLKHFGEDIMDSRIDDQYHTKLTTWLKSLEQQYSYVVYEADHQMTPWTNRCMREADKVLFIAQSNIDPTLNAIEHSVFNEKINCLPITDLVIIHPEDTASIVNTQKWLNDRLVHLHHHIKLNIPGHFSKLCRYIAERSFCLILNGGGARAWSHLGVLKAIEELHIPIDFIGGTSQGALIGGMYAQSGLAVTNELCEKFGVQSNNDYTFPLLSILKGKKVTHIFKQCFNETHIEDLWTSFFCVSTDLSQDKLYIHNRDLLWKAIRASTSLPGIYPPFVSKEGNILVDGAVMNNMPVDIMRKQVGGCKILTVSCNFNQGKQNRKSPMGPWVSGWHFLKELILSGKNIKNFQTICTILNTSLKLASTEHQQSMERAADYLLKVDTSRFDFLDFRSIHKIREIGYVTAMEQLPKQIDLNFF